MKYSLLFLTILFGPADIWHVGHLNAQISLGPKLGFAFPRPVYTYGDHTYKNEESYQIPSICMAVEFNTVLDKHFDLGSEVGLSRSSNDLDIARPGLTTIKGTHYYQQMHFNVDLAYSILPKIRMLYLYAGLGIYAPLESKLVDVYGSEHPLDLGWMNPGVFFGSRFNPHYKSIGILLEWRLTWLPPVSGIEYSTYSPDRFGMSMFNFFYGVTYHLN